MARPFLRISAAISVTALAAAALNAACGNGGSSGASGGATSSGGSSIASGGSSTTVTGGAGGKTTMTTGGTAAVAGTGGTPAATGGSGSGGNTVTGGSGTTGGTGGSGTTGGGANVDGMRVPGTDSYNCTAPVGDAPQLKATGLVTTGLTNPISLAHPPNDKARLFVYERAGVVRLIKDGALVTKPFLDIKSKVIAATMPSADERGLLGIAFHPAYATNGLFYVHYNDKADANDTGDSIIEEYKVGAAPDEADPASARLVLKVEQPTNGNATFRNHKGGALNFGADGFLFIGLGDGGGSGDGDASHSGGDGNGQNPAVLLGKILRIDPLKSASAAYTSPPGNLKDKMAAAAPEIWDYGLRNPFGTSFDGCTGDLYIGDVGQDKYEEVDIEKAGEGNKNYGWNKTEGTHCFKPTSGCDETGITKPFVDYDRQAGTSITGGSVYRGSAIPGLRGTYFYADYGSNTVWSLKYDRATGKASAPVSLKQDFNNVTGITGIRTGGDGEIYFVAMAKGAVYKIEAN